MTVLYHYCSNKSFFSIIKNQHVRLTSLAQSNDVTEGKRVAEEVKKLVEREGWLDSKKSQFKESIEELNHYFDWLGFCLSQEEDLLSQWRGYADDGRGVAIGFSKNYIEKLSEVHKWSMEKIIYAPEKQSAEILGIYNIVKKSLNAEGAGLNILMSDFWNLQYKYKHEAFTEEKEWRVLFEAVKKNESDEPSNSLDENGNEIEEECDFKWREDSIVPYRKFELSRLDDENNPQNERIKRVILGPKNSTPIDVVERFLTKNEFSNVEVIESKAPYR